jgi:DNA (cytosine-5)-methyltransferase 1
MPSKKPSKIKFIDCFAGCGGLSLGLMRAGLEGQFAIERDKNAFETLAANLVAEGVKHRFEWPKWLPKKAISVGLFLKRNKAKLEALEGSIDLLVGGPPCQGFSSAGRRQHDDPRNQLFASYLRIVEALKPRAVLIENVRGFTMDFETPGKVKNYAHKLRKKLSEDYDVYEELLDLSRFGVPQARTRYFLIALRRGLSSKNPFDLLRARLPSFLRARGIKAPVSTWAAISDLEVSRNGTRPSVDTAGFNEICYTKPRTQFQKLMANGTSQPSDLRLARHSEEITDRFKDIIKVSHSEGRLNTSISNELRARYGLKKKALRVLDPDRPSPTITSMPDDLIHYQEPRTLTVRENARLQSFPDWFSFKGKYTTGGLRRRREVPRFTQVANAVPPLVAEAIGELLCEILTKRPARAAQKKKTTLSLKRQQQFAEIAAQA